MGLLQRSCTLQRISHNDETKISSGIMIVLGQLRKKIQNFSIRKFDVFLLNCPITITRQLRKKFKKFSYKA